MTDLEFIEQRIFHFGEMRKLVDHHYIRFELQRLPDQQIGVVPRCQNFYLEYLRVSLHYFERLCADGAGAA